MMKFWVYIIANFSVWNVLLFTGSCSPAVPGYFPWTCVGVAAAVPRPGLLCWCWGSPSPLPCSGLAHHKPSTSLPVPRVIQLPPQLSPSSSVSVLPHYPHHTSPNAINFVFFVIAAAGLGVSYQHRQVTGDVAAWLLISIPTSAGNFKLFITLTLPPPTKKLVCSFICYAKSIN